MKNIGIETGYNMQAVALSEGQRFSRGGLQRIKEAQRVGVSNDTIAAIVFQAGDNVSKQAKETRRGRVKVGPFGAGKEAFAMLSREVVAARKENTLRGAVVFSLKG
jgi:hypothetical protein